MPTNSETKTEGMEVLLSQQDVMNYLNCGRSTILKLSHRKTGNYWMKKARVKIGTYQYRKSMVQKYVESLGGIE